MTYKTTDKDYTNSCKLTELKPQIAKEDIYVYKIFEITRPILRQNMYFYPEEYRGPFSKYVYPEISGDYIKTDEASLIGTCLYPQDCVHSKIENKIAKYFPGLYRVLYAKKSIKDDRVLNLKNSIVYNTKHKYWEIGAGFLHSLPYTTCDNGFDWLWTNKSYYLLNTRYEEWECIIPKGTLYFQADTRGSHYECNSSYASKELIMHRLVNKSEYK